MDRKEFKDVVLKKIKTKGLVISRIPEHIRDEFIEFAEIEFADDYGMCLSWCFNQSMEYQRIKNTIFDNLDIKINYMINLLENKSEKEPNKKSESKTIKMLSGKILKGGVKK